MFNFLKNLVKEKPQKKVVAYQELEEISISDIVEDEDGSGLKVCYFEYKTKDYDEILNYLKEKKEHYLDIKFKAFFDHNSIRYYIVLPRLTTCPNEYKNLYGINRTVIKYSKEEYEELIGELKDVLVEDAVFEENEDSSKFFETKSFEKVKEQAKKDLEKLLNDDLQLALREWTE